MEQRENKRKSHLYVDDDRYIYLISSRYYLQSIKYVFNYMYLIINVNFHELQRLAFNFIQPVKI